MNKIITRFISKKYGVLIQSDENLTIIPGIQALQEQDPLVPGRLRLRKNFGIVINKEFIPSDKDEQQNDAYVRQVVDKYIELHTEAEKLSGLSIITVMLDEIDESKKPGGK